MVWSNVLVAAMGLVRKVNPRLAFMYFLIVLFIVFAAGFVSQIYRASALSDEVKALEQVVRDQSLRIGKMQEMHEENFEVMGRLLDSAREEGRREQKFQQGVTNARRASKANSDFLDSRVPDDVVRLLNSTEGYRSRFADHGKGSTLR